MIKLGEVTLNCSLSSDYVRNHIGFHAHTCTFFFEEQYNHYMCHEFEINACTSFGNLKPF